MKISYAWVEKYFEKPIPAPEKIADVITFHAFEIDSVEKKGGDTVLDVKVLPDRTHDCLSHRGVAKEISVICDIPLASDPLKKNPDLSRKATTLTVTVEDPRLCPRYGAAVIRGVSVKPSPTWLKERLEAVGQRSVNNVVDATNFVMFNVGQPLHAFDASKLSEKSGKYAIAVRSAKKGESITTLDNKKYELTESMLLITDGNSGEPIGIAGIKGGKAAEINETSKDIIIESANFNAVSTRKTSHALKLRTDASTRFENDLSPEFVGYGLVGAVELIQRLAGGELEGYIDEYPKPPEGWTVSVSRDEVNALLGTKMTSSDIESILKRFTFTYEIQGETFHVTVPFERLDLRIKEDLIADIGRIYGYDNIPTIAPEPLVQPLEINKTFYYTDKIRTLLAEREFSEVYTSVFTKEGERAVQNKVESDTPYLRTNLTPSLESALEMNFKNKELFGLEEVRIFEIGQTWTKKEEKLMLGLAIKGNKKSQKPADILPELIKELGMDHSDILQNVRMNSSVAEIDLGALVEALPEPTSYQKTEGLTDIRYKTFSRFPFVLRDIALWVPEGVTSEEIAKILTENAGDLLHSHKLFDEFRKEGKISYAFRLVFQSLERTLSDEEVNKIMEKVVKNLEKNEGWKVR